jgi:hypothetical protein
MPPANDHDEFGDKDVTFAFLLKDKSTADYEETVPVQVFFPRDEDNNPGGAAPNWFYYWSRVYVNAGVVFESTYAGRARTPAMQQWSYTTEPDKTRIEIGTGFPAAYRSYGVGEFLSGIDRYVGSVIHEEKHVDQIDRADGLVPVADDTSFRYGWSWNQGTHNHWDKGTDDEWGVAENDDDGNGTVDDAAPTPPFEPGHGDDNDLSRHYASGYNNWPDAWELPDPDNGPSPIESEAINHSDDNIDEHDYARQDWGNPGKNHLTTDTWDD